VDAEHVGHEGPAGDHACGDLRILVPQLIAAALVEQCDPVLDIG